MFSAKRRKGPSCCGCRWLDSFFPALITGNVPEIASGIKYSSVWPKLSGKNPTKIQTDLIMLPCKSEGVFAIKVSLNKIWRTVKREQKKRSASLNNCALGEHVACEMSQSALVHPGSPGGCAGCRGCLGDHTESICSLFIQAQPRHNQNRSLGCKPDKNSSCQPQCWHHLRKGYSATQRKGPTAQAAEHLLCHKSLKGFGTIKETSSIF